MLAARNDMQALLELKSNLPGGEINVFFEGPYLNALAEVALRQGQPADAESYAQKAMAVAGPLAENDGTLEFRRDYAQATRHLVDARLRRGDEAGALLAWKEYVVRDQSATGSRFRF